MAEGLGSNAEWRELESPRFIIIYPKGQLAFAQHVARASETALTQLEKFFTDKLDLPITVFISDQSDQANGLATYFPYAYIQIAATLPLAGESIDEYENWFHLLMVHELTHLFTFKPVRGFYTPLKYIFGSIVRPNGVLPRWYSEGLAVEMESRLTRGGRLRSPSTFAAWRAMSLSEMWGKEDISRINEGLSSYPYGQRPYLYGSLIQHTLVEEQGLKSSDDLLQRYAGRVPFLLNQPLKDLTGRRWPRYWDELKSRMTEEALAVTLILPDGKPMTLTSFNNEGGQQRCPTLSPDGNSLAYIHASSDTGSTIKLARTSDKKSQKLVSVSGVTRLSWSADSKYIYFDQFARFERFNVFRDLYRVRVSGDEDPERLTFGERSSEPALSPDGQNLIYISSIPGTTYLKELNLDTKLSRVLMKAKIGARLAQPTYLDNDKVAVIFRNLKGQDQIIEINKTTNKKRVLLKQHGRLAAIKKTSLGLIYISDYSGTGNIYQFVDGKKDQALSNALTEVDDFDVDAKNNTLYLVTLTVDGGKISTTPVSHYSPPQIEAPRTAEFNLPSSPPPESLPQVATQDSSYNPWRYMLPRYWIPYLYPVDNGMLFQGMTSGKDPASIHNYELAVSHDTVTQQTSYGASYLNAYTPIQFLARAAETNELLAAGDDEPVTNVLYELGAGGYFAGISNNWQWSLSGTQIQTEFKTNSAIKQIDRNGINASIQYSSSRESVVATDWGEGFAALSLNHYMPGTELLDYDRVAALAGAKFRGFLPARHTLTFQTKYSVAADLDVNSTLLAIGDRTIGGNYLFTLINSNYLLRGYPSGALVGKELLNANLEYKFPLWDIDKGNGTAPWFFRHLDMTIFTDVGAADGAYYNTDLDQFAFTKMSDYFTGSGLEFTLHNTVGYHFPLMITLGLYYGYEDKAGGGFSTFLSIGYSGYGGLDHTKNVY